MPSILIKTNKIKQKPHLKFTQCMTICCIKTREFLRKRSYWHKTIRKIYKQIKKKRGTYIRKIAFLSNLKLNRLKSPIHINR